jgi:hypothetical protein
VETPVVRKSAMLGHCVGRLKPTGYCLYIGQGRLSCCSAYAAGSQCYAWAFNSETDSRRVSRTRSA